VDADLARVIGRTPAAVEANKGTKRDELVEVVARLIARHSKNAPIKAADSRKKGPRQGRLPGT